MWYESSMIMNTVCAIYSFIIMYAVLYDIFTKGKYDILPLVSRYIAVLS